MSVKCQSCGHPFEEATNMFAANWGGPKDGDASICIECGELSVFTDKGRGRRPPTPEEREEFLADERVVATVFAIRQVHEGGT